MEVLKSYQICGSGVARMLRVWTANSVYDIEVTNVARRQIVISGGRLFHEPRIARVAGARHSAKFLWHATICVGLRLEIHIDNLAILTSEVQRIEVVTPDASVQP